MDFSSLTPEQFDKLMADTDESISITERPDEAATTLALMYESKQVNFMINNAMSTLRLGPLSRIFAAVYSHGVRHGWKAREVCAAHTDAVQDFMAGIKLDETDILNSIKPTGE